MKKFVATTGLPYTEGCPINTEFPIVEPTCILTPKIILIVSEGDFSTRLSFGPAEPDEYSEDRTQLVRFCREGILFAEIKVLVQAEKPSFKGTNIPMYEVAFFIQETTRLEKWEAKMPF